MNELDHIKTIFVDLEKWLSDERDLLTKTASRLAVLSHALDGLRDRIVLIETGRE